MKTNAQAETIRKYFAAYEEKDRRAIESLLTPDFKFTSPLDDHISVERYMAKCWPESARVRNFDLDRIFVSGNEAFVHYQCHPIDGAAFENVEFFRMTDGKVQEVVCYFGNCERGHPTST